MAKEQHYFLLTGCIIVIRLEISVLPRVLTSLRLFQSHGNTPPKKCSQVIRETCGKLHIPFHMTVLRVMYINFRRKSSIS